MEFARVVRLLVSHEESPLNSNRYRFFYSTAISITSRIHWSWYFSCNRFPKCIRHFILFFKSEIIKGKIRGMVSWNSKLRRKRCNTFMANSVFSMECSPPIRWQLFDFQRLSFASCAWDWWNGKFQEYREVTRSFIARGMQASFDRIGNAGSNQPGDTVEGESGMIPWLCKERKSRRNSVRFSDWRKYSNGGNKKWFY